MSKSKYEALGASATKSGLHRVLDQAGVTDSLGLFAKVTPDFAGNPEYYSVVHCDGAGTKAIVPYLFYKETGSRALFANLAQDALVMNLDDIYCIGAPESLVLANALARNARLIDDEMLAELIASYRSLVQQFQQLGVPIVMSGGETADCGDLVRTLLVDAVVAGRIAKARIIDANRIAAGDRIVGLSSTGRASYESSANSGIGSNGLTLARHALLSNTYATAYPEVVDPGVDPTLAYSGSYRVSDTPALLSCTVGEALASPTRSYAPILARIYDRLGNKVHAAIHLTGGGQTKMLRFGTGLRFVKDELFPIPPLFQLIQESGNVGWREMFQVFNMGHRMELYLEEEHCAVALETAAEFGVEAKVIGHVEAQAEATNSLHLVSSVGTFDYSL
ncbi:MAG: hypothetical protein KDD69_18125 [Bdellovibrionales bacterium]|nr:hypothetical protein [Bdellovibrionales bacterium]